MNIRDIYRLSLQERKEQYGSQDVQKVIIDGTTFTGYKTYTFYWEKTYSEEPERSLGGVINNLNAVPFFVTPRLKINFSMMSIDDYRKLYNLILSKNEFEVICYNIITNDTITCKMYFEPDDFPTLYMVARKIQGDTSVEKWQEITGVRDYTVTMNGTNASLDLVSVIYNSNPPDGSAVVEGEEDISINTEIIIGSATTIPKETFGDTQTFQSWNTKPDGSGITYLDGQVALINEAIISNNSLILYAQWKPMTEYTLNYSYGLSTVEISNGQQRFNDKVQYGSSIALPIIDANPIVTYDNIEYSGDNSPYYNGGWYTTPIKATNSTKLTSPYIYNLNASSTIYCLYDIREYTLTYNTNDSNISLDSISLKFGDTIVLPKLYAQGKIFVGWFWEQDGVENQFTKKTMPPYNVSIFAKWE